MNATLPAAPLTVLSVIELTSDAGRFIGTLTDALAWMANKGAVNVMIETADQNGSNAIEALPDTGPDAVLAYLIAEGHQDVPAPWGVIADVINAAADEARDQGGDRALTARGFDDLCSELGLPTWHPAMADICRAVGVPVL